LKHWTAGNKNAATFHQEFGWQIKKYQVQRVIYWWSASWLQQSPHH